MKEISEIFKKYRSNKEIFHDLMPLRMREILLVATIYDAFILEHDSLLSEMLFGDYHQLNLANAPRITSVSNEREAVEKLRSRHFDLVIVMSRISRLDSCELSQKVREIDPNIPVLLLLSDNAEIGAVSQNQKLLKYFDNVFVWNGHSELFLAMVKYIEDKFNVINDTQIGLVRIILLVEDSIRYYSRYLPLLYTEIMKQTQRLVSEEHLDEMKKVLRMRARPKVLVVHSYEDAMEIVNNFKDYLLCVISDVSYPKDGVMDETAGVKLIKDLRPMNPDLPILLQSSNSDNSVVANSLGASFINKNSDSLMFELTNFFYYNLGFGDFIFRNNAGIEIARAKTMDDLKERLNHVPAESLIYHASRNHFSAWLMARGEIQIAQVVFKMKVTDFKNAEGLRTFLINVGGLVTKLKTKGKIISFDEGYIGEDECHIFRLAEGSLGGKGRGVAFINSLLSNSELAEMVPEVNIKIPQTAIIGIDEFTTFLEKNKLSKIVNETVDHDMVKRRFLMGSLTIELKDRLRRFLERVHSPLAVRSSGLLEDSLSHPLSGLYQTFFLPNNHPDLMMRLNQLMEAIKLVYASVYSKAAHAYFEAINYKIEEERMAVVIQQVVGTTHEQRFYPDFSGVAQSYNFYPFSYIEPGDGVANVAIGLGKYVVGGEQSYRFCPAYPQLDIVTPEELLRNSQKHFYALDLSRNAMDLFNGEDSTLLTLDLKQAETDGILNFTASVWDQSDMRLRVGLDGPGPRVLNFAYILKYDLFPLAKVLQVMLGVIRDAMETPVEIEFAVNLEPEKNGKPSFYLLQIKHLLRDEKECLIDLEDLSPPELFLYTNRGMGNGMIEDLTDIVWVDPLKFDKSMTREMAAEAELLNEQFKKDGKKFVLLGPGRWGTRDRWLGIPISWPQISHARVIVEYSLDDFRVDASLGSHFFHNVTSLNIGYFTIPFDLAPNFIDWDWLRAQEVKNRTNFFVHTRLQKPLRIQMDGRKGIAVIFKEENS
ncbi:MAG: PEP/pyruvate-binding domain-containing protein [Candidatus Ozemobacteraceae bacterium]